MRKLELSEPFIYMISGKKTFTSGIHFSNKWDSAYWCPGLSASVYTFYRHHIHTHTHTHTHTLTALPFKARFRFITFTPKADEMYLSTGLSIK